MQVEFFILTAITSGTGSKEITLHAIKYKDKIYKCIKDLAFNICPG